MTDVCSPIGLSSYLNARRVLLLTLFILLALVSVLSWSAVQAETQKCNSTLWKFVFYNYAPELYAEKCGCPNNLDFRFSCNSQYLGVRL